MSNNYYDTIVIGAGLSGLSAGIHTARQGRKVLIVDGHYVCGQTSFHERRGRSIEVGLHAMTKYVPNAQRDAPFASLFGQLGIDGDEFQFADQRQSRIVFPGRVLNFSNDLGVLQHSIAKEFHQLKNEVDDLNNVLDECNAVALNAHGLSARRELKRFISDPDLRNMLLLPLMYYGEAIDNDMDFARFAFMWRSVFQGGLARPEGGMRRVVEMLESSYRNAGGELILNQLVTELHVVGGRVEEVVIADGRRFRAGRVLSSAGYAETMQICNHRDVPEIESKSDGLSFAEVVIYTDKPSKELGVDDSIIFFSNTDALLFHCPNDPVDFTNGVICCTDNFSYRAQPREGCIRLTFRASFNQWRKLLGEDAHSSNAAVEYQTAKSEIAEKAVTVTNRFVPHLREHMVFTEVLTPLTLKYLKGRSSIHGAPVKHGDGSTELSNLFIIGVDQGFLGIIGAMLSGVAVSSMH